MDDTQLSLNYGVFLNLLNAHKVEYLLVGGFAVRFYGYVRPTKDLDVWVSTHPDNAEKLLTVCQIFGSGVVGLPPEAFLHERRIIRIDIPPIGFEILDPIIGQRPAVLARVSNQRSNQIEILTIQSNVIFDECYSRLTAGVLNDTPITVISLADLKTIKKNVGRPQDVLDLAHLP